MKGMELVKRENSKKGYLAVGSTVATLALFSIGWWYLGILGVIASVSLAIAWFSHRGKWGLKF